MQQTIEKNELSKSPEDNPEVEDNNQNIYNIKLMGAEYKAALDMQYDPESELGSPQDAGDRAPRLLELPEMKKMFSELGIDLVQASDILRSWASYCELKRLINPDYAEKHGIPDKYAEQGKQGNLIQVGKEVEAFILYAEKYSKTELQSIIGIFGIHHFSRYDPEQLHSQLENWLLDSNVIENVVVSAHYDWNGNMSNEGEKFSQTFKGQDVYFFEAGSGKEIAEKAVLIGNRERLAGREPKTTDPVKNFVIHAHANPEGMLLSSADITVKDYEQSSTKREKIGASTNNYRRHLGDKFRIILQACSTAGENPMGGPNIAETISDEHDAIVEASKLKTRGRPSIRKNGKVKFGSERRWRRDRIGSTSYDGRNDSE